jgi:hypothetical protein
VKELVLALVCGVLGIAVGWFLRELWQMKKDNLLLQGMKMNKQARGVFKPSLCGDEDCSIKETHAHSKIR